MAARTGPWSSGAHTVPRAGAGWTWQSVRLCLFPAKPGAVLCKVRAPPASGTPGWGEVQALREGGAGPGGARREAESWEGRKKSRGEELAALEGVDPVCSGNTRGGELHLENELHPASCLKRLRKRGFLLCF